jgi:hypothetical protein
MKRIDPNPKEKYCRGCKETRPVSFFHPRKDRPCGYYASCRLCVNKRGALYKRKNFERIKQKFKPKKRPASKRMEDFQKMKEKFPEKIMARTICRNAVALGKLKRLSCEECGEGKSQAHHEDYSKPLDVKWLCRKHHAIIHRKYK